MRSRSFGFGGSRAVDPDIKSCCGDGINIDVRSRNACSHQMYGPPSSEVGLFGEFCWEAEGFYMKTLVWWHTRRDGGLMLEHIYDGRKYFKFAE